MAVESLLVIAVEVVQAANDKQQVAPMLGKIDALPETSGDPKRCWPTMVISARPM